MFWAIRSRTAAESLGLTSPAVKAALHRGRQRLAVLNADSAPAPSPADSPVLARYLELFNARDWEGVRALLADDVRLDVVSVSQRRGREKVGVYFSNYAKLSDWRLARASLDGRPVLCVFRPSTAVRPAWFIEVTPAGGNIAVIRDYHHVPYITAEADFRLMT
jgi:hypothetical protein